MKKILALVLSIFCVFVLCSCEDNPVISEKTTNYTYTYTVKEGENSKSYTVKRNGSNYAVIDGEQTSYYNAYELGTFKYVLNDDVWTTEEDEDEDVLYARSQALAAIKKSDLEKNGSCYTFKTLEQNDLIANLIDEDITFDTVTDIKEAYKAGLLTPACDVVLKNGKLASIAFEFYYNSNVKTISIEIGQYGSTKTESPVESHDYSNYVGKKSPKVTIEFAGYGKVELQLFTQNNVPEYVNYFIYMIKSGLYEDATIASMSDTTGNSTEKSAHGFVCANTTVKKNYIECPDELPTDTCLNKRGIVSVMCEDGSNKTTGFVINYGESNSYDESCYVPVAGIVSGFEVLEQLMLVSDFTDITLTVTYKANGYSYTEPKFFDVN